MPDRYFIIKDSARNYKPFAKRALYFLYDNKLTYLFLTDESDPLHKTTYISAGNVSLLEELIQQGKAIEMSYQEFVLTEYFDRFQYVMGI